MTEFNFLVIGSGAREHAICHKLKQSTFLKELYLADANDGFKNLGVNIDYGDFDDLAKKAQKNNVDILVVGSENYLAKGIVDIFEKYNIKSIGANAYHTQLESSKSFAKDFMQKHGIKTAGYKLIEQKEDIDFTDFELPYVIKADGLCGGKGVVIANNKEQAQNIIEEFLSGKFGEASIIIPTCCHCEASQEAAAIQFHEFLDCHAHSVRSQRRHDLKQDSQPLNLEIDANKVTLHKVLLEEFLEGEELSLMSAFDGKTLKSFIPARDFKKLSAGKNSPNTGGMAAYCPIELTNEQKQKLHDYEKKLEKAFLTEKADFTGFIYSGLIWAENDFYVLEYNMRLGDPEVQALLMSLKSDLGELFFNIANKSLDKVTLEWSEETSACLTVAVEGYPDSSALKDGELIENIDEISKEVQIFYAGVKEQNGKLYSKGGRILSLCTTGEKPFEKLYYAARQLKMKYKYFRSDIK